MIRRRSIVRALDAVGLKRPVKAGINRLLAATGLPSLDEPAVFRDLERLARTPRPRPARSRGRLLILSTRGWTGPTALHALIAEAAAQRGFEPTVLSCGGPLPVCAIANVRAPDPTPCANCHGYASRCYRTLGIPYLRLEDLVTAEDREGARRRAAGIPDAELESFEDADLPLGEMSRISVCWYLLRGSIGGSRWASAFRGFLESSLLMRVALERLLGRVRPDRVLLHNGLNFDERLMRELARRRGIPLTTGEKGFLPATWLFRHEEPACRFPIARDFLAEGLDPLREAEAAKLDRYLEARREGREDVRVFWPRMERRREELARRLGIRPDRPVVSAFTNISWDTAVLDRHVAFDSLVCWLADTVRCFAGRGDAQLVIRVHPAEVRIRGFETAEGIEEALRERLGGTIPPEVRLVPPSSALSSYELGLASRLALVYTSTMGLELALLGVPVVVAGRTHYRGLGFTIDVEDRGSYASLLDRLLRKGPGPVDVERARRYAYYFFFRFMLPLPFLRYVDGGHVRIGLRSLDELGPGRDTVVDLVLDGILERQPLVLDRETAERLPG